MKEKEKTFSDYVNTDHLLASAAIVECLWSKFDALIPQRREEMSPLLTEAILFLKETLICGVILQIFIFATRFVG